MTRVLYAPQALIDPTPDDNRTTPHRVSALITIDPPHLTAVEIAPTAVPDGADVLPDHLLLTPAFVDAHTHLTLHALRGVTTARAAAGNLVEDVFFRVESHLTPDDIRAFTRVGGLEAMLSGTAVVHDHFYAGRSVAEGLRDIGLAGLVAPALQDLSGPGAGGWEQALDDTAALDDDDALHAVGIGAMVGPHATDTVSDRLWRKAAELAEARSLPGHAHLAQSPDEHARAVATGARSAFDRLDRTHALAAGPGWQLVHGLYLDGQDLDGLAEHAPVMVACPRSWARFGFPADVVGWKDRGLRIAVGSDAAPSNDAMVVQAELAALDALWPAAVPQALPLHARGPARRALHGRRPDDAMLWRAATSRPGAIHPRLRSGRIAAGHLAHLAVWDTRHPALWPGDDVLQTLVHGRPAPALAQLMVAGRWRGPRGVDVFGAHVLGEDRVQAWIAEATQRRRALWARAGI